MTKIILCRHGHVEGISPERFRGRAEIPLTPRGIAEAHALAARIAAEWKPAAVYTSPLKRCVDTGAAIAEACGIKTSPLEALNDIHYGAWQWKTHEEAKRDSPELFWRWFNSPWLMRFPQGDSLQDLMVRTSDVLRFVLDRHTDDVVVLVGHESVNRALLMQVMDQPLSAYWRVTQTPCALNEIELTKNSIRVLRLNDINHLRGIDGG